MKNVLIICGSFPPQSFVGGLRPAMFAKYLRNFGWNSWILTRNFTNQDPRYDEKMQIDLPDEILNQVFKVEYSQHDEQNYLQARSIFHKIRDFFHPEYSSPPGIFFAARELAEHLLAKQKFDIILATIPDQWELTLGAYLAKKYKIPLVADFRDIMEQESGLKRPLRQWLQVFRMNIRRYLTTRQACHITTVSKNHKVVLQKKLKRQTTLIYNGYDEDKFKRQKISQKPDDPFRIIYVGRILNVWYRNPQILFAAIDQLIESKRISESEISVEFFGTEKKKLDQLILKLKNKDFIQFSDRIIYSDVPQKLNEAHMLLLLTNKGRQGILTTKFFEYAGVKKPILCVPGDGNELDELIERYNLGYSIRGIEELKIKIEEWVNLHKRGCFPEQIDNNIEFFTRKNQTKILAEIFTSIIQE